jgi:hypothetical protein
MRIDKNAKTIHENACIACKETACVNKSPSTKFGVPIVLRLKKKKGTAVSRAISSGAKCERRTYYPLVLQLRQRGS